MLSVTNLADIYNTEQVLMVLISRLYFNKCSKPEVQEFIDSNTINWNLFRKIIRAHSIRPFIYHIIQTSGLNTNNDFIQTLKRDILPLSIRNLHQKHYTGLLVDELNKIGIKAIPYKGGTFGNAYYQSSALRESTDIDLFIGKDQVERACAYFTANNFKAKPGEEISKEYLSYYIATGKDLVFKTPNDGSGFNCSVEIQWRLVDPYIGRYPEYDFFKDHLVEMTTAGGSKQLQLAPTYDFIALVSHHFIKDSLTRFKFLVDAACILTTKGHEIDAQLVQQTMGKYGYSKLFSTAISAINDLLGVKAAGFEQVDIPRNPLIPGALAFPAIDKTRDLEHIRLFMRMQDTPLHKIKAALRLRYLLFPNIRDINSMKLPFYLLPVFLMTRPFRLGYKYLFK